MSSFADQLVEYDESFWGEYNFIRPDESLEDALIKLSKISCRRRTERMLILILIQLNSYQHLPSD